MLSNDMDTESVHYTNMYSLAHSSIYLVFSLMAKSCLAI